MAQIGQKPIPDGLFQGSGHYCSPLQEQMYWSSSICFCKIGNVLPLLLPPSPTHFQEWILKPTYLGFVESFNSSTTSKISFPFKKGLGREWSQVFSAGEPLPCSVTSATAQGLCYCWKPGVNLALQQPLKQWAIRNWLRSCNPWWKCTETLQVFPSVMIFLELITLKYPKSSLFRAAQTLFHHLCEHHSFQANSGVSGEVKDMRI